MPNSKAKYIGIRSDLIADFYFCDGILLISDAISEKRKLEILKHYL